MTEELTSCEWQILWIMALVDLWWYGKERNELTGVMNNLNLKLN